MRNSRVTLGLSLLLARRPPAHSNAPTPIQSISITDTIGSRPTKASPIAQARDPAVVHHKGAFTSSRPG
jgi:hypothetical protein